MKEIGDKLEEGVSLMIDAEGNGVLIGQTSDEWVVSDRLQENVR